MSTAFAQQPNIIRGIGNRIPRGGSGTGGNDSLQHRNRNEDSITLYYHYLDSTRNYKLDSSISDYTRRFPIPAHYVYLGNVGTAAHSLLFDTKHTNGWDAGFHAFDLYKWKLEDVRFFNTTRPYTELGYMLGSQSQQIIEVTHTQNIRPYWNFALGYRLINAPGFYKNQKTNHNNYVLSSWYQSPKKRYNNYFALLGNSLQAGENGGIRTDRDYLNDPVYHQRFNIPTKLGGDVPFGRDFFTTDLFAGNRYTEFNALMRQQYDLGRKDSIVTDSTVIPLFYPRLRFEHTLNFGIYKYAYKHIPNPSVGNSSPDSTYYTDFYHFKVPANDSILLTDKWREITNDFSIYQFPDAKNLQQYIKAGIAFQILKGSFNTSSKGFYNVFAHGEYRNTTRNKKWDMEAFGNLYLNGYNAGDYRGYISLQRFLGSRLGSLQVGFENINRSPSFTYDKRSSFYLDEPASFNKENITHFFGALRNDKLKLELKGDYYLLSNYLYHTDFYKLRQEGTLFNVLRIGALKTFAFGKYWRLYSEVYAQQKTGNVQVNFPSLFTRNRLAFEGNFFKNLYLSTGVEARYHTPYKGDNYSPMLGQFFYQDSVQINNLPTVDVYFNFRIRSFRAFVRTENLNSVSIADGFGFTNNSVEVPDYPYPGLVIRAGIYWSFVN